MHFIHLPDRAIVRVAGDLTLDVVEELVDTVDMLRRVYFYALIELRIGSRGGTSAALGHYCDALARWRAAGLRIRTRAVTVAESGAAIVLSLGDERIAEPRAQLMYHKFRLVDPGVLTADRSASVCQRLCRLDEHYLARLVERAFEGGHPSESRRGAVDDSDLPVLDRLTRLFPGAEEACAGGAARIACVLERFVQSALRDRDPDPIALLYTQLFDSEMSISPAVAHLLRLVDHVGDPAPAPARAPVGEPGLTVPEWSALYPPSGDVPREFLTRHTLGLGDTGSGKTASVVLPVLQSALRAPRGRFSGGLVIDPKRELAALVEREAPERMHLLRPSQTGIDLMAGEADSLARKLREWRFREVAQRIVLRALAFERHLPTRVLLDHQAPDYTTNAEFWDREAAGLLLTVVAFVLLLLDRRTPAPEEWLGDAEPECRWVRALRARAFGGAGERGDNVFALVAWVLDSAFAVRTVRDGSDSPFGDMPDFRFARVALAARTFWLTHGEATDVLRTILEYWLPLAETSGQFRTIVASARAACGTAAEPALATRVYFGCEPAASFARETGEAIGCAVGTEPDGPVLVYQPSGSGSDVYLAKAIKALFFEGATGHPDRVRGGAQLPLACYVADEAHAFVTADPVHGDAGFLERCRSLGVFCVLACQSVASLEHALAQRGGGEVQDRAAVTILATNTASKLVFRSTDPRTADLVDDLCPIIPGLSPMTHVRPLSTLGVGECYAAVADGRLERRQLEPVLLARDCAARGVDSRVLALPAPPAARTASGSES